jgi:hypothetical protein
MKTRVDQVWGWGEVLPRPNAKIQYLELELSN